MSFLNGMIIGQFIPMKSVIHGLSARTKLISTMLMIIGIFFANNFTNFCLIGLFALFVLRLSSISVKFLIRGIRPLLFIFILTFFVHIFMTDGEVIWRWAVFSVTKEGIRNGGIILFRLFLLVIYTTILTLTTSPIDLSDGIETLLKPFKYVKFPVHEFALMMTIALRFIPTLVDEIERIESAQRARGADFSSGGLMQRIMNFIPILIPLFILSFKRADELALAMESRCYKGGEGRTKYYIDRFKKGDFVSFAIVISFVLIFIGSRII